MEANYEQGPDTLRARTYAATRGLDPDVPEQLAQARVELQAMSSRELADYTDGLRWQASVTNNHGLLNAALAIDDPDLTVRRDDAPEVEEVTEQSDPSQGGESDFRSALARARTALASGARHHRHVSATNRDSSGTDRDLSL